MKRRHVVGVAVAVFASFLLVGCGGGSGTAETPKLPPLSRELDITLDGYPGPENVAIMMAEKRGYFEDEHLKVWIRTPQSRMRPLLYVAGKEVALAVSHQPQVVLAADKGAPVTAFGSLISQPTAALIWLKKSKIGGIADLKGKTIAITGLPFERAFLESILERAGLKPSDVKIEGADYELTPALESGRADAIFGSWNLEGAELEAEGLHPVVTKVQSLGIPAYEEFVLISRSERLAKEPGVIRRFMSAVERGTAAAIEDPKAAVNLIAQLRAEKPSPALKAKVRETLPLLSKSGEMEPGRADRLASWMREQGMVEN